MRACLRQRGLPLVFENKFFHLFIMIVWMSGLLGIFLTMTYALQVRSRYRRHGVSPWAMPRIQAALYASITIFCIGLALHAFAAQKSISLWIAIMWGGLAILFLLRLVMALSSGVREGWDLAHGSQQGGIGIDRAAKKNGWTLGGAGVTLVMLSANVVLLIWWGSTQLEAGRLDLTLGGSPRTMIVDATPTNSPTVMQRATEAQHATQPRQSPQEQATNTATTPPSPPSSRVPITPTAAVLTLTAETITPSPLPVLLPTPTPSPAVTVDVELEPMLIVRSAAGANVRAAPSLSGDILTTLADETVVNILGRTADNQWYLIRLDGDTPGWISSLVVELVGTGEEIPVIDINS
jgi:hypothetical protein